MGIRPKAFVLLVAFGFTAACAVAPVGRRDILFQSLRPADTEDIFAMDFQTGAIRRITHGQPEFANSFPVWSPSGRQIAFVREFDSHDELFVLDSIQGMPRHIPTGDLRGLGTPAWSPDGRELLVPAGESRNQRTLYRVDYLTSTLTRMDLPAGNLSSGTCEDTAELVGSAVHCPRFPLAVTEVE